MKRGMLQGVGDVCDGERIDADDDASDAMYSWPKLVTARQTAAETRTRSWTGLYSSLLCLLYLTLL